MVSTKCRHDGGFTMHYSDGIGFERCAKAQDRDRFQICPEGRSKSQSGDGFEIKAGTDLKSVPWFILVR